MGQRRWIVVLALFLAASARTDDPTPANREQIHFFENKIRPILAESCFECHGSGQSKGSLSLESLSDMLSGGDSGPAVVPGNPDESLIIEAVNYKSIEMPPTGKLDETKIALLREWIAMGAPFPGRQTTRPAPASKQAAVTDEDRAFWSFQRPKRSAIPTTRQRSICENPIDAYLGSRHDNASLTFSVPASPRELVRRLAFDVTGLPPDVADIEWMEATARPDAWSRLVDRMLASPRYGERWGRHWLDVVRFAQTNGYERDSEKPYAWRYRDYVIQAFNEDRPYDRFVREQIAGDEMDPATDEGLIATGFSRIGVWDDEPDDPANAEFEELDDIVSTMGQAVLGLTIGCARCHDHKFDPISQQDYYSLIAFFRNVRPYEKHLPSKDKTEFSMLATLSNGEPALSIRENGPTPPPTHVLTRGDARSPASEVSPRFVEVLCATRAATDPQCQPAGNDASTSGRRTALADWLTSQDNPLTARVIVNRLWQHHFGQGIVTTPSDFGKTGSAPSHPELLDWLAAELVEGEWRLKRMHRWMLESTAYRQSSRIRNSPGESLDPDNRLVWRQSLRRLEAECLRDAVLAANGTLHLEMAGRGFFPDLPKEVLATQSIPGNGWDTSSPEQQARRSVYIFVKRTLRPPLLESLDFATPDQPIAQRAVTTIAPQALLLLNSEFMDQQSLLLADRLAGEYGPTRELVDAMFLWTLQRMPSDSERRTCAEFVLRQKESWMTLESALESGIEGSQPSREAAALRRAHAALAKLLFNSNEFAYVD